MNIISMKTKYLIIIISLLLINNNHLQKILPFYILIKILINHWLHLMIKQLLLASFLIVKLKLSNKYIFNNIKDNTFLF
jgi:hypothetical protein